MRNLSLLLFVALMLGGSGCGKGDSAIPANLTPEQIEAGNKEQKKVDGEEKAHLKADPSNKQGAASSVDEEERRARGRR